MPTHYQEICATMVEAMDPELRLTCAELEGMAARIARRMSPGVDDAQAFVLKMDRVIIVLYAQAGKAYGPSPEARWRWWFEQIDA
jgi:hypothetical protein